MNVTAWRAELGAGHGVIYRAHDLLLEREVAVKLLSQSELARRPRRLLHEAQSTAKLIIRILSQCTTRVKSRALLLSLWNTWKDARCTTSARLISM